MWLKKKKKGSNINMYSCQLTVPLVSLKYTSQRLEIFLHQLNFLGYDFNPSDTTLLTHTDHTYVSVIYEMKMLFLIIYAS